MGRSRRRRPATGTCSPTSSRTSSARTSGSAAPGAPVDRLQWDVKLYLALNGAVHDAAIAAWGLKGYYDSVRPISMIRYMGGLGQSSDPALPSYNREGLPLVPGLIEVITKDTTAPGSAMRRWPATRARSRSGPGPGNPQDPKTQTGGVVWMLAVNWVPYQLPTFVTPALRVTRRATARSAAPRRRS